MLLLRVHDLELPEQGVRRDQRRVEAPLQILYRHEVLRHALHEVVVQEF